MPAEMDEKDYILGTEDRETQRLGIQHDAWSEIVHECWRSAGVGEGDRIIDVGAGPGYAAFDLARIAGRSGHVTAVERSSRFIEAGRRMAESRGVDNVEFVEVDLMHDPLPGGSYDAAWCRWVASFVESPARLVERIASVVRPGGVAMFHEYADYGSWRYSPSLPHVEEYIGTVMASWREAGGEPDVAARLSPLLIGHGFEIERVVPRVYAVHPGDRLWTWIATFVESNVERLAEIGTVTPETAESVRSEFEAAQNDPRTIMLTPMVLEIVARKTSTESVRESSLR